MARRKSEAEGFDRNLVDLDASLRWREWMNRIEAVIFASSEPVRRETLAMVVGDNASLELLIADIQRELKARPFEIVEVAGGYQFRTRPRYGEMIRLALGGKGDLPDITEREHFVLLVIAYFQPVTRSEISAILGRDVSYDTLGKLRREDLIGSGPRSPQPGAPHTLITTPAFLARFGLRSLNDLPDLERLREEGLLDKDRLVAELDAGLVARDVDDDEEMESAGEIENSLESDIVEEQLRLDEAARTRG